MSEKKELNEQELKQVSGGNKWQDLRNVYNREISIDQLNDYYFKYVYFYGDRSYVIGYVTGQVYQMSLGCRSVPAIEVTIYDSNNYGKKGSTHTMQLNLYKCYVKD